jgi:hypothetical protein
MIKAPILLRHAFLVGRHKPRQAERTLLERQIGICLQLCLCLWLCMLLHISHQQKSSEETIISIQATTYLFNNSSRSFFAQNLSKY